MSDFQSAREALLIATARYASPALSSLRSPVSDVESLGEVLRNPAVGNFNVDRVLDGTSSAIAKAIEGFLRMRHPKDVLLLYLSCHGLKDEYGELYFAGTDTDKDYLASTAVSARLLHDLVKRCASQTVIIILDCCYSGAFLSGFKGEDREVYLRERLAGVGRAVLTATNRTEYAWEGDDTRKLEGRISSRFTQILVQGLESGDADRDGDGRVGIEELYGHAYEEVVRLGLPQTPLLWSSLEYKVFIADAPTIKSGPTNYKPRPYRSRRGQDALIRAEVSLDQVVNGGVTQVAVDTAIYCFRCHGDGLEPSSVLTLCAYCGGTGHAASALPGDYSGEQTQCPECEGERVLIKRACTRCEGEGRVPTRRTINVRIPAGVSTGNRIHLAGHGEVGVGGGEAGDLYVELREAPHNKFERTDQDLRTSQRIARSILRSGGIVEVETLGGLRRARIPPGLQPGQVFRLKGCGVPSLKNVGRGDLYVRIR